MEKGIKNNQSEMKTEDRQALNAFFIKYLKLIIPAACLLVFAAGSWFFLWPEYQRIDNLINVELVNRQKNYKIQEKDYNKIIELEKAYQDINSEEKDKIAAILSKKIEFQDIILIVDRMIVKNGMLLNSIRIETDKNQKPDANAAVVFNGNQKSLGTTKLGVNFSGANYFSLRGLIKDMEESLPLFDILLINFSPIDGGVSMEINTYYLK